MDFLYFLESIRVPALNECMLLITQLGEEMAFLVIALILFWCIDKRWGYYILSVGFVGTLINQFMKLWFRIPRPWILDKNFTIVEQAREGAGGYSFPSGHTQSSVGTFGGIACLTRKRWIRYASILIAIVVPFSRMYLGVHTPLDVFVSVMIALVLLFVFRPLVFRENGKYFPAALVAMMLLATAYLCFIELYPFPTDIDEHNLASGTKNAYTLLGALLGMLAVYIADKKWLQFPVKAVWWAQILKVLLGLGLVLAVKSGLSAPLDAILDELPGRAVRYFLIVITAGIVWPLSFRWFSRLGTRSH